jgi:hypothetical protein
MKESLVGIDQAKFGRTTEGTLGRQSSTVANRARRRGGGGVSINIIKLAAFSNARSVPNSLISSEFRVPSSKMFRNVRKSSSLALIFTPAALNSELGTPTSELAKLHYLEHRSV